MSDAADAGFTQWLVGAVAAGFLAVLGFLAKFTFGGVLKRLDEIKAENDTANRDQLAEIRSISSTQQAQTTALALIEARQSRLESDTTMLRIKVDDTQGWLQSKGFRKRDGLGE